MRPLPHHIKLEESQRQVLEQWARAHSTPQQVVKRCQIILQSAEGKSDKSVSRQLGINRHTCRLWRERFVSSGVDALWEIEPGRGRKVRVGLAQRIIEATLHTKPKGQTHWSTRELAKEQGVHPSTVARIWQEHELKPHRHRSFKLSRDGHFVQKLLDVVGIYLNPPQNAVVLCMDEKSQIQALDRTQPGLPLKKGRCGTWTHDYVRHGTTTLFAALNVVSGKVSAQCYPRHRHQEFIKFLRQLDTEFEPDVELHLIMDNYGTHKHEKVRRFLERHGRFKVHYIPTSSSWLNLVERWFAELSGKAVRRGSFASVPDLIQAILDFIAKWNAEPTPFVWTAKAEDILVKVERCRQRLEEISPGCTKPKKRLKKAA
jgi:transposase